MLNRAYLERLALLSVECRVSARDAILYALSMGLGQNDLAHVYEGAPGGLRVFASMALVLGDPGPWWRDAGCGAGAGGPLHGEQSLRIYAPIPLGAALRAENRIVALRDCRGGHGAVTVERNLRLAQDGALLAQGWSTLLFRGDGGFGDGFTRGGVTDLSPMPERAADAGFRVAVGPDAALLYRLNGDGNPLHVDHAAAQAAGFARPILHGLASLGMATVGLRSFAAEADWRGLAVRFAAPVYPGDDLAVEVWRGPEGLRWRASVAGRLVMDRGLVQV